MQQDKLRDEESHKYNYLETEILRLSPQNDILGQPHSRGDCAVYYYPLRALLNIS